MDLGLQDKVILVTGDDKEIGNGIVRVLSEEGMVPEIVGRKPADVAAARAAVQAAGGQAYAVLAERSFPGIALRNCCIIIVDNFEDFDRIFWLRLLRHRLFDGPDFPWACAGVSISMDRSGLSSL